MTSKICLINYVSSINYSEQPDTLLKYAKLFFLLFLFVNKLSLFCYIRVWNKCIFCKIKYLSHKTYLIHNEV